MSKNWQYKIEHRGAEFTGTVTAPDTQTASWTAADSCVLELAALGSGIVRVTVHSDDTEPHTRDWLLTRECIDATSRHVFDLIGESLSYGGEDTLTLTWYVNGEKRFSQPPVYDHFVAPELHSLYEFGAEPDITNNWEPNETYVCIFDRSGEELIHAEVKIGWKYVLT